MPNSKSERRQRVIGGVVGVSVLALAMTYHFLPALLHVQPDAKRPQRVLSGGVPPLGFEQRPRAPQRSRMPVSEADAGPPLSLAPHAVIIERLRRASSASSATPPSTEIPALKVLLTQAADALDKGNLSGDADSAMSLYLQAIKLRPDSVRARSGLAHVQQRLVTEIEDDLSAGDAVAAQARLAVLQQLPDAKADSKRLQRKVQSLQRVRPLLVHAAELMSKGRDMRPPQDNALAVYRQVLDIDADNSVAHQGLQRIQRKLLDQALGAVARDDFGGADAALAKAEKVNPDATALQDTRGRIEGIRRRRAESRLQQANTALDGGDLALAQKLRDQALLISADVPGIKAFGQRVHNARVYASYRPGQHFSDSYVDIRGQAPTMVVIPTGSFMMGSPESEPGHEVNESPLNKVEIKHGLAVSRTEISVAQFRQFVRESGYVPDSVRLHGSNIYDGHRGTMRDDNKVTWQDNYAGRRSPGNHPVVNISWRDATAYATWLSKHTGKAYRLLSEAEYEYVMRGGTDTPYWWGSGSPRHEVENLPGSRDRSPLHRSWTHAFAGYHDGFWGDAPVGHFAVNPFGLHDIDGNVSEWVEDCWHDNYTRAPRDGSAWVNPGCRLRMIRGASWGSSPVQARSAFRVAAAADMRSGRVGFRVAREL